MTKDAKRQYAYRGTVKTNETFPQNPLRPAERISRFCCTVLILPDTKIIREPYFPTVLFSAQLGWIIRDFMPRQLQTGSFTELFILHLPTRPPPCNRVADCRALYPKTIANFKGRVHDFPEKTHFLQKICFPKPYHPAFGAIRVHS